MYGFEWMHVCSGCMHMHICMAGNQIYVFAMICICVFMCVLDMSICSITHIYACMNEMSGNDCLTTQTRNLTNLDYKTRN